MSDDLFCPRHGRRSRPIEIPGLRCDCGGVNALGKCGAEGCDQPGSDLIYGIVPLMGAGVVVKAEGVVCAEHKKAVDRGEGYFKDPTDSWR